MKKVLYFYPHKFAGLTDGIHTRIITILEYFKSRDILVDMVNFDHPDIKGSYAVDHQLVENLYLVPGNPFVEGAATPKKIGTGQSLMLKLKSLRNRIAAGLSTTRLPPPAQLPNFMTAELREKVSRLLTEKQYDAILVTYTYWGELAKIAGEASPSTKKVIDPTDFLTLQNFYSGKFGYAQVGNMFGDEIERTAFFDEIIHISYDELLLFSNFIPQAKHHYIPQFFGKQDMAAGDGNKKYDILFIGSGNTYNQEGITWFLEKVYPQLSPDISIAVAGNICSKINFPAGNITRLGFVDEVAALYHQSRLTICPLRRGSGMKIKVVESLSFGVPVVSTLKGLDGFSNRYPPGGALLADDPGLFAATIRHLLTDAGYYNEQCREAKLLFDRNFSYDPNFEKLDRIFGHI